MPSGLFAGCYVDPAGARSGAAPGTVPTTPSQVVGATGHGPARPLKQHPAGGMPPSGQIKCEVAPLRQADWPLMLRDFPQAAVVFGPIGRLPARFEGIPQGGASPAAADIAVSGTPGTPVATGAGGSDWGFRPGPGLASVKAGVPMSSVGVYLAVKSRSECDRPPRGL
jgi:hypothetical protein